MLNEILKLEERKEISKKLLNHFPASDFSAIFFQFITSRLSHIFFLSIFTIILYLNNFKILFVYLVLFLFLQSSYA